MSSGSKIGQGRYFNIGSFANIVPEIVTQLPQDIDGKKVYIIDVEEGEEYQKKYKDR